MTPWQLFLECIDPAPQNAPAFSVPAALVTEGLNQLSYLPAAQWVSLAKKSLGVPTLTLQPGAGNFIPATVVAGDGTSTVVAIQGTKSWQQWALYAAGGGVVPWLPGRGKVFGPFASLYHAASSQLLPLLSQSSKIYVTGSSLGAAIGSLLLSTLQSQGFPQLRTAYLFACPVHGDAAYLRVFSSQGFTINHPLDPVRLLPADAIARFQISPWQLAFGSPLGSPGAHVWPFGNYSPIPSPQQATYLSALAAQFLDPTLCAHNGYIYLRSILISLSPFYLEQFFPFIDLLKTLGLLDPWTT